VSLVAQVNTPTVADPPLPTPVSEAAAEKTQEEKKAAEEAAQQRSWREIAEQREAEERSAAERRAAEEQAAEEAQPAIPTDTALSLTVPSAGIENDPVTDSVEESVLANGAGKIPSTGFPWQEGANTYIAAHVYGYPGTGSWQQFARVPNMVMGDQIFLTDSSGTIYEYRVSEILTVAPTDVWVVDPVGQSTVSLQTCVGPNWSERLVVRGTLVGTSQA
jgi:sortase A